MQGLNFTRYRVACWSAAGRPLHNPMHMCCVSQQKLHDMLFWKPQLISIWFLGTGSCRVQPARPAPSELGKLFTAATPAPHSLLVSLTDIYYQEIAAAPQMAFRDFSTLTFDVIGTLIDFEAGILEWMRPRLQAAKADVTDDEILEVRCCVWSLMIGHR